jgi:hypothetical protein
MELAPGPPQYHQQQQELHAQDDRRVPHHQPAAARQQPQAQAYHSAPMWQQQQQTLDSGQRPAQQPAFNSELLSQDLEQVMSPIFVDWSISDFRPYYVKCTLFPSFLFLSVLWMQSKTPTLPSKIY